MADNQSKPNYPPSDSSEDEEEEVSGSEEEEEESSGSDVSDSDSEPKKPEQKKPELTKIVLKPREPEQKKPELTKIFLKPRASSPSQLRVQAPGLSESESEEEEEEESGSDSDSDSPLKKPVSSDPKPISSKPMESVVSLSEQVKKTVPPANVKRQAENATGQASDKDVKKPKTSNTVAEDDSKKQLFQRLWSEDDEIVILKGMIDYNAAKNGESPSGDMGAFHEFIKKSLHVDVSRAQLVDKVRRLKKKFVNNVGREKNGKDRMFSKSHEQKGYELSKLIWGSGSGISGNESKKNGNGSNNKGASASTSTGVVKSNGLDYKEDSMMDVEKSTDISRFVQYGRSEGPVLTEEIMKGGIESLEGRERVEMEEKWKELKKLELELFVKRMDLLKEQAVRVLEVVNSSR